jgi:Tol biopolymer transport system component/predicted Ser/Thr protein kinase
MTIEAGQQLLHYRLIEQIGEGGMGVVWKARDTTLDRDVAIKTLPTAVAEDPERLARFAREARMLATLNHPNIAGVYGLHEVDGLHFIAMELVTGENLAERLTRGPLAVDEALETARQIAEALEAAHEQGVIHRDLKPANVQLTPDGQVKVLDLGLAKALVGEASGDPSNLSRSPTLTTEGTVAGALLGTAAYMSPEQAKARPVDRRADVWAFGCVFFEMLTGKKGFGGDGISETLASVLRDDPDWDALPAATPAPARHILRRCLDRNVKMRLRDIGEARVALSPETIAATAADDIGKSRSTAAALGRFPAGLLWATALAAIAAAAAAGWFLAHGESKVSGPEVRAAIRPPDGQVLEGYGVYVGSLTLSPDGTRMTFSSTAGDGRPVLHVRSLGSETSQPLTGTEGATFPFWSPDGRSLAFFIDGKLKRLNLDGGAPMTICSAPAGRGGTWGPGGEILFAPETQSPIYRVSASGGEPTPLTTLDSQRKGETTHRFPSFLPDGRHFLFVRAGHAAALDDEVNSLWVGSLDGNEPVELMHAVSNAAYASGQLFYVRDQFLMARPFDADTLEFTGEPFVVGEGLVYQGTFWRGAFAVAENGVIAFQGGLGPRRLLIWYDRQGNDLGQIGEPAQYGPIRLSQDGRRLAATINDPGSGHGDIWIFDLARDVASRLTFSDAHDTQPVWSPDGKRIAFQSDRERDTGDVYVVQADGRSEPELLFASDGPASPTDWSLDGQFVSVDRGVGKNDLWIVPIDGSDPFVLVSTPFDEGYARFSPNGKWVAYISNESGQYELYLTRFPSGEGKWQLSAEGGDWAIGWKEDGSEIYYLDLEGALCSIRVELGDNVVADRPQRLFSTRSETTWASSADGRRFLLGTPDDPKEGYPITLIVNWAGKR